MTPADFRRLALSLPQAVESAHMGHPDFRVGGKVFASLGFPNREFGAVMLTPDDQEVFLKARPKVFTPAPGAWGRAGSTQVRLGRAPKELVRDALTAAWRRRVPGEGGQGVRTTRGSRG